MKKNHFIFILMLIPLFLSAFLVDEQKVNASDGAAGDEFGDEVSISGNYAIIGSRYDDDNGGESGSAYIFQFNGTSWVEQQKLTASDSEEYEFFGYSVAIDGDYAVIGAMRGNGGSAGAAYIFQRSGDTWVELQKLEPSDDPWGSFFGSSVDIEGDVILVGADGGDVGGISTGTAYIFRRSGDVWLEEDKIYATDGELSDYFGCSVRLSGDYAIIGSRYDDDNGEDSGAAYIFHRSGTDWLQQSKLTAFDGASEDYFGNDVSIFGEYAVVSAIADDDNGEDSGSVYMYKRSGTSWSFQQKITPSNASSYDLFGSSVKVENDILLVGAIWLSGGTEYVFKRNGTEWIEIEYITSSDGNYNNFGGSSDLTDDFVIIGACVDNEHGGNTGAAYFYRIADRWTGAENDNWHNANNWLDGTVPTSTDEVVIPNGTPNDCRIYLMDADCNNLYVYSGADLEINDETLNVENDVSIAGNLTMNHAAGIFDIGGDITWEDGSSASITAGSSEIFVEGDWTFAEGADVQLNLGYVEFDGSSVSVITNNDADCYFNHVRSAKTGSSVQVSSLSEAIMKIHGTLYQYSGSSFIYNSEYSLVLENNFNNMGGHFQFNDGLLLYTGSPGTLKPNSGDYLHDLTIESDLGAALTLDATYSNVLDINGNFVLESGYFYPHSFTVEVGGDWNNLAGIGHFGEADSRVIFNGNGVQFCSTEQFNEVEVAKPFGFLRTLPGAAIQCETYDWTSGGIYIGDAGAIFKANDLADSGLYGTFEVHDGCSIDLYQDELQYVDLNGNLKLNGGTINIYGGAMASWWSYAADASITMSGGILDFHNQGIYVHSANSLTTNITGGTIRTSGNFICARADFTPTGGTIELYGSTDVDISQAWAGSNFHNLFINKQTESFAKNNQSEFLYKRNGEKLRKERSNTVTALSDLVLTGDLTIGAGVFVAPDNLSIGGDWTNLVGDAGFVEGTGRVIFNGNEVQYCSSENFYELEVAKPLDYLRALAGAHILCETYDWTSGGIYIGDAGATFTANDLADSGLYGTFEVHDGCSIDLYQDELQYVDLNGNLKLYGGTINIYGDADDSYWTFADDVSITMTDGTLDFKDVGIQITSSINDFTVNITGGTIRTAGSFQDFRGDFVPESFTLEMYGSSEVYLRHTDGSNLCDVIINKSEVAKNPDNKKTEKIDRYGNQVKISRANAVYATSDLEIDGGFVIQEGLFDLNGNEISIGQDVEIDGTLQMFNFADILNIGDSIFWRAGSNANCTHGEINIGGNWNFENGTECQLENTVNFVGLDSQLIYNYDENASFGEVAIYPTDGESGRTVSFHSDSSYPLYVTGNLLVGGTETVPCIKEFVVQNGKTLLVDGELDIEGWFKIENSGSATITGAVEFYEDGALILENADFINTFDYEGFTTFQGFLSMNAGSVLDFSSETVVLASTFRDNISGGTFRTGVFWAEHADTFQPTGGTVEIQTDNGSHASIICSNGNSFYNLVINPISGGGGVLESNVIVQNNLDVSVGNLWFDGFEATVLNDVFVSGGLIMDNPLDVLNVGDELGDEIVWQSGSGIIYDFLGTINVYGDWVFEDGTEADLGTGSTVNFVGGWNQFITCYDADAAFGNVNFNQTAGNIWLHSACTQPMRVNGNMTILNRDFKAQNGDLIVTGILDIQDGTSLDIGNSGSVTNHSDFDLDGALDVGNGQATVYGQFTVSETGSLNIGSGTLDTIQDGELPVWNNINGSFSLNDGVFSCSKGMSFNVTSNNTILGGTINAGYFMAYNDVFQPVNGEVHIHNNLDQVGALALGSGSFFWDLTITGDTALSGAICSTDITVQNDIEIESGRFLIQDRQVDVEHNLTISGELDMTDGASTVNVFNNITFADGSSTNVTNGTINIYGNWTFAAGTNAMLEDLNTINLIGDSSSLIMNFDDDAEFANLIIDKLNMPSDVVQLNGGNSLNVNSFLWVKDGTLALMDNSSLRCNQDILVDGDGILEFIGTSGNEVLVSPIGEEFSITIGDGGTLSAEYAIFEKMDENGLNIQSGGLIDTAYPLHYCTFRDGADGGSLLTIANNQIVSVTNPSFYNTVKASVTNISKTNDAGSITINSGSGNLTGPAFENDPFERVHWLGMDYDLEIIDVVWSNSTPYAGDNILVDVTLCNNGTVRTSECELGLYYDSETEPEIGSPADRTVIIPELNPSATQVVTINLITNGEVELWNSYVLADWEGILAETDETNNIAGPEAINWQNLPAIEDLTIEMIGNEVHLNWSYPLIVDRFIIYKSSDPTNFSGVTTYSTTLCEFSEIEISDKFFYRVTAERDIEVKK